MASFSSAAFILSSGPVFAQYPESKQPDFYYLEGMKDGERETLRVHSCTNATGKVSATEDVISLNMECPVTLVSRSDLNQFIADFSEDSESFFEHEKPLADLRVRSGAVGVVAFTVSNMVGQIQIPKVKNALIKRLQSKHSLRISTFGALASFVLLISGLNSEAEAFYKTHANLIDQIHGGVVGGNQEAFVDFLQEFGSTELIQ